jgi:hypothetical protein
VAPQWLEAVAQVPETVNGLILSRYDRLAPPLKHTLDAAAVLGHGFSLPMLLGITTLTEAELRAQLAQLEQADFLRRVAGPGLPVYAFRHWLMQEASTKPSCKGTAGVALRGQPSSRSPRAEH